jgi:hypothetical protein
MQNYAKRFRAQQEQSRRRKRDHEELGYAVHVHKTNRKPSFTQLFLIFFSLLPGESNLTDCRDPRAHRFSMPRVKIWRRENLLT